MCLHSVGSPSMDPLLRSPLPTLVYHRGRLLEARTLTLNPQKARSRGRTYARPL